jgi:hypothetical protein
VVLAHLGHLPMLPRVRVDPPVAAQDEPHPETAGHQDVRIDADQQGRVERPPDDQAVQQLLDDVGVGREGAAAAGQPAVLTATPETKKSAFSSGDIVCVRT